MYLFAKLELVPQKKMLKTFAINLGFSDLHNALDWCFKFKGLKNRLLSDDFMFSNHTKYNECLHLFTLLIFSLKSTKSEFREYVQMNECLCFSLFILVLPPVEEALLSDCQNLSDSDQAGVLSSTWQHHQSHAGLQKGRARDRGGQTMPQSWTWPRL